jgi:secreted trypsin-like serine protease
MKSTKSFRLAATAAAAVVILGLSVPAWAVEGGRDADIQTYPYMGQLDSHTYGHVCGVVLIGPTTAVTTASCVGMPSASYSVTFGSNDKNDVSCAPPCVNRDVTSVIRHPNFDATVPGLPYDIAVLHFSPIDYNSNVVPIELASPADGNNAGETCTITGWGNPGKMLLQEGQMTVMTNTDCSAYWGPSLINDGHVCSADANVGPDPGDGGGALECGNKLAGLISWGHVPYSAGWPTVSTRISQFHDWIWAQNNIACDGSCQVPPPNQCQGNNVVGYACGIYSGGLCIYKPTQTPCPSGCANGACK